ncbi:MAG: hypothetical protein ACRCZW_14740, partial [Lactobacillaceae bacterium]
IRLFFKTLMMLVIPYCCAVLLFAGIFLAITLHHNSLWRQILAALAFGIFMYFIRILMKYPIKNLYKIWCHSFSLKPRKITTFAKVGFLIVDIIISYFAIINIQKVINYNTIVIYFNGICFIILFISLLIGNIIPPSLAVIEDHGSND